MALNQYPQVLPNGQTVPRDQASVINGTRQGKLNCLAEITLTAGAASTVFTAAGTLGIEKVGPESYIDAMPLTANAAAEKINGTFRVSAQGVETVTFAHANNGQTDRTFRLIVIG